MKLCKHGNIVELLALFETSAQCCLVMELFEVRDIFFVMFTVHNVTMNLFYPAWRLVYLD